jgi:pimeloyl-ACP methyl ester carboxylesterase
MRSFILLCAGTACLFAADPAPMGRLIDLGGYRLHLYCTGGGRQTVVLSPGSGDFSFAWYLVQKDVSSFARVCSYDRAESAWSDPGPEPRTIRQEAFEIYTALGRAKERGPFVLVGHSMGGLVMRSFAEHYPGSTAGLVLVAALSPDTTLGYNGRLVHMREMAKNRPIPGVQTMKTSPPKLLSEDQRKPRPPVVLGPRYKNLPEEIRQLQIWAASQPRRTANGEDYLPEELKEMYEHTQASPHMFGSLPLISIIAMRPDPRPQEVTAEKWDALFQEKVAEKRGYAELSTNSKVVEADSRHEVHLYDPGTVVTAIREVVEAGRGKLAANKRE